MENQDSLKSEESLGERKAAQPLISCVITSYRREPEIVERALKSILAQTYSRKEILLIDDNRGEEGEAYSAALRELADRYSGGSSGAPLQIKVFPTEEGHGAQYARNTGIRHATGEYIAFLDDDDEWMPEKLSRQLELLLRHPEAALCYCNGYIVDERLAPPLVKPEDYLEFPTEARYQDMLRGDVIGSTSKPLIRKAVFDEVGMFDTEFPARQDYEMWLRITKRYPAVGVPEKLTRYHITGGKGQISMDKERCIKGHKMLYQKYKTDIDRDPRAKFNLIFYLARYYMKLGKKPMGILYFILSFFTSPAGFYEKFRIKMNMMKEKTEDRKERGTGSFLTDLIFRLRSTEIYRRGYMPARNFIVKHMIARDPEGFIRGRYRRVMGREMHLDPPVTYTEKLQWRKLYDNNPLYTRCADKAAVRDYVREVMGFTGDDSELIHIPKLYGLYDRAEDVNFDVLPDKFVLKPNHASGFVMIVPDKSKLNRKEAVKTMRYWLSVNFYYAEAERHYKDIVPKIICEELLDKQITDYRIYCFDGVPRLIRVTVKDSTSPSGYSGNTYNCRWQEAPFTWREDSLKKPVKKPDNLQDLITMAGRLSRDFTFVRVDLYSVEDKVYFSELTFTPESGYQRGVPYAWDRELGKYFRIDEKLSGGKA